MDLSTLINNDSTTSKEEEEKAKQAELDRKGVPPKIENEIVRRLFSIMPDFAQNIFTFGFLFDNEDIGMITTAAQDTTELKDNPYKPIHTLEDFALKYFSNNEDKEGKDIKFINNNINGFYTRVSSFDIPLPKARTTQIKFLTRTINKPTHGIEQPHFIEVNFEADQNGYLINFFERLAGFNNSFPTLNQSKREIARDEFLKLFTPGGFISENAKKLHIYVKYNDTITETRFGGKIENDELSVNEYKTWDLANRGQERVLSIEPGFKGFFLEDVKFLGFTNNIEFERDNANPITMTAKFKFKKLYKFN